MHPSREKASFVGNRKNPRVGPCACARPPPRSPTTAWSHALSGRGLLVPQLCYSRIPKTGSSGTVGTLRAVNRKHGNIPLTFKSLHDVRFPRVYAQDDYVRENPYIAVHTSFWCVMPTVRSRALCNHCCVVCPRVCVSGGGGRSGLGYPCQNPTCGQVLYWELCCPRGSPAMALALLDYPYPVGSRARKQCALVADCVHSFLRQHQTKVLSGCTCTCICIQPFRAGTSPRVFEARSSRGSCTRTTTSSTSKGKF